MATQSNLPATACQDNEADLVLLHYGDLDGTEGQKLATHLAACPGCTGYLKELAKLMPLTVKSDQPTPEFWLNYNHELRQKIADAAERQTWQRQLAAFFQLRYLPACAAAAVVVLAVTFTLGKSIWTGKNDIPTDDFAEALPVAENLEFFGAMDILDDLDLLEILDTSNAA